MMEKIERDMKLVKAEKNVICYGFLSVAIGVVFLVLGVFLRGTR